MVPVMRWMIVADLMWCGVLIVYWMVWMIVYVIG